MERSFLAAFWTSADADSLRSVAELRYAEDQSLNASFELWNDRLECDYAAIVIEGHVWVESRERRPHRMLGEGDFLGISILDNEGRHSGVARCFGDCSVLLIPGTFLRARVEESPFAKAILVQMRKLIHMLYADLYDLKRSSSKAVVAGFVKRLIFSPVALREETTTVLPFSLNTLADLIGMSSATVRTACRKLEIGRDPAGGPGALTITQASLDRINEALS